VDDGDLDIELRAPEEVAERCIILAALIRRLSIESLASDRNDEGLSGDAFDLHAWLQNENLWDSLGNAEVTFLERPLGHLDDDEMAFVAWQAEGLASLGWSLGLAELQPLGELRQVQAVLELVPSPWDAAAAWIGNAGLRPEPDIARERDRAELFEWRASIEAPRRVATGPERTEYDEAIADVASEVEGTGLAVVANGDLLITDSPLASLQDDTLDRLTALAEERLRALNWLCGFGDAWDRVPLDV
jgi:hypothetical protein